MMTKNLSLSEFEKEFPKQYEQLLRFCGNFPPSPGYQFKVYIEPWKGDQRVTIVRISEGSPLDYIHDGRRWFCSHHDEWDMLWRRWERLEKESN